MFRFPATALVLCLSAAQAQGPVPYHDQPQGTIARHPGDGSGAFVSHQYRNLFAEQGHPDSEVQVRVDKAFAQLFHGDALSERVYFEAGSNSNGPLAYITDWANNDARSEGMSYGMMIAVEMNKKHEFDALWNWSNTYMRMTDSANPNQGYFAWSMNTDGTPRATGPAPDGEEYYAMALLFAARRWGNGAGLYDYQAEANRVLHLMVHHPQSEGTGPFKVHAGDAPFVATEQDRQSPNQFERAQAEHNVAIEWKGQGKTPPEAPQRPQRKGPWVDHSGPMMQNDYAMVRFVPDLGGGDFTDASYHLPAFYELFARWGPTEDGEFWLKAADVSREFFHRVTDANTGLAPDRSHFDGSRIQGWQKGQLAPFAYDSWRTASNWSVDASWWHKDPGQTALSDRVQRFLISQGISQFVDVYTLDGQPLSTRHSVGLVATTAVAGLAATRGGNEAAFVEELWRTPVPVGEQRYFDGMLYIMSLLHASGRFRIIE